MVRFLFRKPTCYHFRKRLQLFQIPMMPIRYLRCMTLGIRILNMAELAPASTLSKISSNLHSMFARTKERRLDGLV